MSRDPIERSEEIEYKPRLAIMTYHLTHTELSEHAFLVISAIVYADMDELAFAITYPENRLTHSNSSVFPLKDRGNGGM